MPISVDDLGLPLRGAKAGWDVPFRAAVTGLVNMYNALETMITDALAVISGAVDATDATIAAAVTTPATATAAALNSTYVAHAGNPSGSGDQAMLQALINAMPSNGGRLILQPGVYEVETLTVNKPVHIIGQGGGIRSTIPTVLTRSQTVLRSTSGTATMLNISVGGVKVSGVTLVNEAASTPTAGAGIAATGGVNVKLNDVTVADFYDAIDLEGQQYCDLRSVLVAGPVRYGLRLRNTAAPDSGDSVILGGVFLSSLKDATRAGATAIRLESGGGLRVIGSKINWNGGGRWLRGIDVDVAGSVPTSILVVSGCSIENCTDRNISVRAASTTAFSYIVISGNELTGRGGTSIGVQIGDSSSAFQTGIAISGNVFVNFGTSVYLEKIYAASVGANTHVTCATVVNVGPNCREVEVLRQAARNTNGNMAVERRSASGAIPGSQGSRVCEDSVAVPTGMTTATYVDLYSITIPAFSIAQIEVNVQGLLGGIGATAQRQRRAFLMGGSGSPTMSTVGTDELVGQGLEINYVLSANTVLVQARYMAGSVASSFDGGVRVRATDRYTAVTRIPASI